MAGTSGYGYTLLLFLVSGMSGSSEGILRWSGRGFNAHEGSTVITSSTRDVVGAHNFESLKLRVPAVERRTLGASESTTVGGAFITHSPVMFTSTTHFNVKNTANVKDGVREQMPRKRELARVMREQFDEFKESLARTAQDSPSSRGKSLETLSAPSSATNTSGSAVKRAGVQIGEVVTKSERRAGEDPSGIKSGVLRIEAHPIPVTFTSLPGFPSFSRGPIVGAAGVDGATTGVGAPATGKPSVGLVSGIGSSAVVGVEAGGVPSVVTRVPGVSAGIRGVGTSGSATNGVRNLMKLLESRLIGGIREATAGTPGQVPSAVSPTQHFDPSIVVNFLTLVALSQHRRGGAGSSSPGQRNASPAGGPPTLPLTPSQDSKGEFGPFSTGDDPSAGVDPSTIVLPPMLRQTLYSYLLPRLASLTALVETVPGVPGLDYPIISTVPYTNFYCSDMPWPGFYADTEARCQVWHYCDLDGRQASFLCPNGTMFNQAFFVCDWWYNLDCQSAPYLYSLNERVFSLPEVDETAPHRTLTKEILDTIFL
ncbi:mucin-19 [Procambarus clarkii]|uniref:mucin-19 n=1 Tax=Procambarus clarkii TaxID=6728 RepID=UPI00374286DF